MRDVSGMEVDGCHLQGAEKASAHVSGDDCRIGLLCITNWTDFLPTECILCTREYDCVVCFGNLWKYCISSYFHIDCDGMDRLVDSGLCFFAFSFGFKKRVTQNSKSHVWQASLRRLRVVLWAGMLLVSALLIGFMIWECVDLGVNFGAQPHDG